MFSRKIRLVAISSGFYTFDAAKMKGLDKWINVIKAQFLNME